MNFTIIIPCHKDEEHVLNLYNHLKKCTHIIQAQIVCVHTHESKDHMLSMIMVRATAPCRAIQMNQGAATAHTDDILIFLHADVTPPIDFLECIKTSINKGFEAGFFSYEFRPTSTWLRINSYFTKYDGVFAGGGDQCLFIKNDTFRKLGGFDESKVIMEDFDLIRRIRNHKIKYTIIQNNLKVSSRKYNNNSYLKVNLINLVMMIGFYLNFDSNKLKMWYAKMLNPY
jgi:predicted glycosyltransferase involved in capsule biosynthesis